jgi:predicted MPP superfamily phosphohydrolase
VNQIKIKIPSLPEDLKKFKIVQFSDLHIHPKVSDAFLQKLVRKIKMSSPDLIVFTGDFLYSASMNDERRLGNFLNSLSAPYGCYAVLGNHDYDACVSVNHMGDYDIISTKKSPFNKAFARLQETIVLTKNRTERAKNVPLNQKLINLINASHFILLHNETRLIQKKNACLNLCGLGEYILGRFQPEAAFKHYNRRYPGVILTHNPDSVPHLKAYPGDLILCGHTHGGQVNLPWFWKKFTLLENMQFKRGLFRLDEKWMYVNRGVGGVLPFRWFSVPEILVATLE